MTVVLITGAASGIGLALTLVCLKQGYTVVMLDMNQEKLHREAHRLQQEFPDKILPFVCDITNAEDLNQVAHSIEHELGRIDYIYNNAGIIGTLAPVWELTIEQIHQVVDINVYGMLHVIRAFIPFLFKQNFRSHIINMASLYALCSGSHMASYAMSKHAVLALSESLYFDLKRQNKPVDVSVVFPSFTDTALLNNESNVPRSKFHHSLNALLAHSRPALDVAEHIIREVEQKQFYILPDKEVKGYSEERVQAIIMQELPHVNSIEKLIQGLLRKIQ